MKTEASATQLPLPDLSASAPLVVDLASYWSP